MAIEIRVAMGDSRRVVCDAQGPHFADNLVSER